ncbi:MAG TPA: glutamyl-tRNA reductase [Spirochaetota bacterium]|nr:glutamyl-tRNA reductase [Spirochaetota bacterium]HQO39696.1 glutamyl-tRNA reductase [Spirochaetota bacterium]
MRIRRSQQEEPGRIIVLGINHRTAPVETREIFSLPADQIPAFYERLNDSGVHEAVYVSTCNRVEIYMTAADAESAVETIKRLMEFYTKMPHEKFMDSVYVRYGRDAVRHLFTVASSLDSMVVGENEITGQIKESYRLAVNCKTTGVVMNKLFHRAFSTAKRIRTETDISKNPLSIASIAVEQAKAVLGDLSSKSALLIGAGEMGELILKYLVKENLKSIILANRTEENARRICQDIEYRAEIIPLSKVDIALEQVDIVISSVTAPHHVITARDLTEIMNERNGKDLFLIDIAVPRNIEPSVSETEGVFLFNIDNLKDIAENNRKNRTMAIEDACMIIEEDLDSFADWCSEQSLTPTIVAIKNKFEEIRQNELDRFRQKKMKHLTEDDFKLIDELTLSIMNRTLHNPIVNLKKINSCSDSSSPDDTLVKNTQFLEDIFTK